MQINLKATNIELTPEIRDYVLKKVTNLGKLLSNIEEGGGEVTVNFEVGKSTNHHKSGAYFHADCLIKIRGEEFYASADEVDPYQAIDEVKSTLFGEISKNKDRKRTLFTRGARKIKKMMKGIKSLRK